MREVGYSYSVEQNQLVKNKQTAAFIQGLDVPQAAGL